MQKNAEKSVCRHCRTPLSPPQEESGYCCSGCEYVSGVIHSEGLTQFYDLQDGPPTPVSPGVLRSNDDQWLRDAIDHEESTAGLEKRDPTLSLDLQGISCTGCVWLIERLFERYGPVGDLDLHPQRGQMTVSWKNGDQRIRPFFDNLRSYGYTVAELGEIEIGSNRLVSRIGLCGALALNTMLFTLPDYLGMDDDFIFANLFRLIAMACATLSFLVGGGWFIQRAWRHLREGLLPIDVPISIGLVAAYTGSLYGYFFDLRSYLYFDFVAVFVFLMIVGRWVHERALERNRNRVKTLGIIGRKYEYEENKKWKPIGIFGIKEGMKLRLRVGQMVPVASRLDHSAEFSLESINGEPEPRTFSAGSLVPSGAQLSTSREICCVACENWQQSLLYRLTSIKTDARRNELMENVLKIYISVIIVLALIGWLAWGLGIGDWEQGGQVLLSILVVSCPCAMGVAYPLINDLSTAMLRASGVYLREASFWSRLAKVRSIVFDKTGTLTLETMDIQNKADLDLLSGEEASILLRIVYNSFHPVGRTLREALVAKGVSPSPESESEHWEELPGMGVVWQREDGEWSLGRRGWKTQTTESSDFDSEAGRTTSVQFAHNGISIATYDFTERVRDGAAQELGNLHDAGFEVAILSGDHPTAVSAMASHLGLPKECALGGLSPFDKEKWVREKARGPVLMIGDGLNDSLVFEAACARGTPLLDRGVLEARSDFFFTGSDLKGLRRLLQTDKLRTRTLYQVFGFSVSYNLIAISVCMMGWMNPLLAAILMPISSIVTLSWASWHFRMK